MLRSTGVGASHFPKRVRDDASAASTTPHILTHRATQIAIEHNKRIYTFIKYVLNRELYKLTPGERKSAVIENSRRFLELRTIPENFIDTICHLDQSRLENVLRCYEEARILVNSSAFIRVKLAPEEILAELAKINAFNGARLLFTGDRNGDDIHEDQLLVIHICRAIFFTVPVWMDEAVFYDGSLIHTRQKINSVIRHAYVYGVQAYEPYFYDCELPCFRVSSDVIRASLPTCKSTSGRVASETTECSQESTVQFEDFSTLRTRRQQIKVQLSHIKREIQRIINLKRVNPSAVTIETKQTLQNLKLDMQLLSEEDYIMLIHMIENRVLNCGEYAEIALRIINESRILKDGYEARIAQLHNSSVPSTSNNHDHAFLEIVNQKEKRHYVVDFWQSTTWPAYTTFVGTLSHFIEFLNDHPDGQYVRRELLPITLNDIQTI